MIGVLLNKTIPWIIPLFLFASWIYNWKSSDNTQKKPPMSKDTSDKQVTQEEHSDKDLTE